MSMEGERMPVKRYGGFEDVSPEAEQQYFKNYWERVAYAEPRNLELTDKRDRGEISESDYESQRITPEDVMHQAAERDNKLYDKWSSPESQEQQEDLKDFFNDLRAMRDGAENRPEQFKLVSVCMGAGVATAQQTGQDMFLEDAGYAKLIDVSIGSSGASGPILFRDAGESNKGASIFMNLCPRAAFLSYRLKKIVPWLDTGVVSEEMRHGERALDTDALHRSKAEVFALVTDKKTGIAELLDMKKVSDPMLVCEASSAVPGMAIPEVTIDGKTYVDGAFSDLPLETIIERFKPTHLMLQPNRAFEFLANIKNNLRQDLAKQVTQALGSLSPHAYSASQIFKSKERVNAIMRKVGELHGVKIAILWPPDEGLDIFTQDPDLIRIGVSEAYRKLASEAGDKQPERINFFQGDNFEELRVSNV